MTLKEAKTVFLNRGFIEVDGGTIFDGNAWRNAVLVISDWFKAEPCEDAVSKQMVKEQMIKYGFHTPDMTVTEFVEDLSFANSQQPCEDAISRKSAVEAFQMFRNYNSNRSNKEWVNRIETVLNQLPPVDSLLCEDAVSRQAVLDLCDSKDPDYKLIHFEEDVECLPPVNPQELKTGYWIHHKETFDHAEHWECSRCHRNTMTYPFIVQGNDYNAMFYCPKCGVKMPECEVEEV